jgi:hypothetical protein
MSQSKVKLYKHPDRNKETIHKPYVPQYQLMGVEPEEWKSSPVPTDTPVLQNSQDNPRLKNTGLRQDIKISGSSSKNVSIPNVGQNRDYTWSGVDGDIVDDIEEIDNQSSMIDNNDYISDQALGLSDSVTIKQEKPKLQKTEEDILSVIENLEDKDYLLLVNDVVVCSGTLDKVEEQVKNLAFGEHELCGGEPIPVSDLIVLKKVPIKIGVFLD